MRVLAILSTIALLGSGNAPAQSFTFVAAETTLAAPVGSEIVFDCTITNTSPNTLTLLLVRTVNNLPQNWESAMCVTACYPPEVDSIVTPQMSSGDTLPFSMHIYTVTNAGTGIVRVVSSNTHNPLDQRVLTFTGNGISTDVHHTAGVPDEFSLFQNYPNPFNPSTTIEFKTVNAGFVSLKVYDLLGNEVSTLADEVMSAGSHRLTFDARSLSSGVYMCRLRMNDRVDSRRLLLIK